MSTNCGKTGDLRLTVTRLSRDVIAMVSRKDVHLQLGWCFISSNMPKVVVCSALSSSFTNHDDVIKWKHFPRYWPYVRRIHRSPVNSPHKGQWRGALMFSLICAWINGSVNNHEAGDLWRICAHYDVTVMCLMDFCDSFTHILRDCFMNTGTIIRLPSIYVYIYIYLYLKYA